MMAALSMATLFRHVPWWVKLGSKLVLARMPLPYTAWRHLGVFKHGAMLDSDYALHVFDYHFRHAQPAWAPNRTILELGPGDSLATALLARVHGASRTWLVDRAAYASPRIDSYRALAARLNADAASGASGHSAIPALVSLEQMLDWSGGRYLVDGLRSLSAIPSGSVDFSFSHAVLEHVRRREFAATIAELFRVAAPGGLTSHRVDLRDHLGGSLHNLRFSRRWWESDAVASSGFYTNRLRMTQIGEIFRAAGFEILSTRETRWPALPLARRALNREFALMTDEELTVSGFDLVARKPERETLAKGSSSA
jgi:SAM-dependent methyltransferase